MRIHSLFSHLASSAATLEAAQRTLDASTPPASRASTAAEGARPALRQTTGAHTDSKDVRGNSCRETLPCCLSFRPKSNNRAFMTKCEKQRIRCGHLRLHALLFATLEAPFWVTPCGGGPWTTPSDATATALMRPGCHTSTYLHARANLLAPGSSNTFSPSPRMP